MTTSAARILYEARTGHRVLDALPERCRPATVAEGYAAQADLTTLLGEPIGWKVACTNETARRLMGAEEPFAGPMFAEGVHESPASLDAAAFNKRIVEGELAFRLGADLPPRPEPYTREEVESAVASLHPAIEIADTCFEDPRAAGVPSLIADVALSGAFVYGPPVEGWRTMDLTTVQVRVQVNGSEIAQGTGAEALGEPALSALWLVNRWRELGWALEAGQLITTGTLTGQHRGERGETIVADFGDLGSVSVRFE